MKKIYIWEKNGVLNSTNWNLYLNEEWVIEVQENSKEENICKSYGLLDLEYLNEKYLKSSKKVSKSKTDNLEK